MGLIRRETGGGGSIFTSRFFSGLDTDCCHEARCTSRWNGGILKEPFLKLCQVRTTCLMANRQLGTWKSYAVLWRTG